MLKFEAERPLGMAKLNTSTLDAAIAESRSKAISDRTIWCSSIPGFGARIRATGRATFILQYRNSQSQQRKYVIGRYGAITVYQARTIALQKRGEVASGLDPAAARNEVRLGQTMSDLARVYIEKHLPTKRSASTDLKHINRRILPKFGGRKITSLTYEEVRKFHKEYGAPTQANRCLSTLSRMLVFAKEEGMISDPTWVNPTRDVKRNPERKRERYVYDSEMPRLLDAVFNVEDAHLRACILVGLFTGIRRGSLLNLEWRDIDFEENFLIERAAKQAKAGEIIRHRMTASTREVLLELPRKKGSKHVFLNNLKRTTFDRRLRDCWDVVKKQAKINEEIEKLWFHDLRKTMGSWMAKYNFSSTLIKEALKHKTLQASQRYQHVKDGDTVLNAMEHVTQKMLEKRTPTE